MNLNRRIVRYVAAANAAAIAAIYLLIGAGVLKVVEGQAANEGMLAFGVTAGGGFLLGAILLAAFDRRWLWILGAILQVAVVLAYLNVAPMRTPAFEIWGITLRVLQIPLFAALVYLATRPAGAPGASARSGAVRWGGLRG